MEQLVRLLSRGDYLSAILAVAVTMVFIGVIGLFFNKLDLLTNVVREEKKLGIAVFIFSLVYVFVRLSGPMWESLIFALVQGKAVHSMAVGRNKDLSFTLLIISLIYVFVRLSGPEWEAIIVILVQVKAVHWMLPDPNEE